MGPQASVSLRVGDVNVLNIFKKNDGRKRWARVLEQALVSRARDTYFFEMLAVPDTIDGRFDLVALHAWLVLARLRDQGETDLSQALMDSIFVGFDEGLREMGAGDIGMGRRLKKMANAFYGRLQAYDTAEDENAMASALLRNVYRGNVEHEAAAHLLARYVFSAREALSEVNLATEEPRFGPLPS